MTPQSNFMILAPIAGRYEGKLRELLASMNEAPGSLIPFAEYETLHFARLVVLDDQTTEDFQACGLPEPSYPLYLALLGDVDGDADVFLRALAQRSSRGLSAIFSCCEGFDSESDLLGWMRERAVRPAAAYVNWLGRTVRMAREDAALRREIVRMLLEREAAFIGKTPRETHALVRGFLDEQAASGRLTISPEAPTALAWRIADILHLIGIPFLLLLISPLLLLLALFLLPRLRVLEKTDLEICPRVSEQHARRLAALEDHDVTNQFTAMGSLKPGLTRRWITTAVLGVIDYAARHVYTRGRLARVRTIHFARWVFLDGKKRVLFISNYDGSLESYMDDFINKVGFGLNLSFSNGIGYPRTSFLVGDGCSDERNFKEYLRRHQLPTQVWYNAHAGLTAVEMERNMRIRQGLTSSSMTDEQLREWVALL